MNLPLTATRIAVALDDFKHNQSGLPWQRVALQLLRPSFPHLVAHHITSDQGADAISYANDSNGETVAFGCSITCIRTKIRDDCQEIERSGKKVHRFIFATSVSKTKVELAPWIMGLESQFKIRIDVLEREHFVQLLLRPENHWICRDYLHIPIGDGTSHDEKFAAASLANRVRWRKQNEIYQDQLIDLRYFIGDDEPIDLERLVELVKARVDIILTGSPGAGKNVSLAQLAERLVDGPVTPFIVSLDGWAESKKTLPDYVASQPECSLAGVKAAFIRTAVIEKRVVFLLNGWNEIGAAELARAYRCLREERAAMQGISVVLATRPSSLLPPLPGSAEIRVAGLSRRQRREFIEKYRADSSIENRLDTDPVLDEISRTPLFLRAILAHASSGKPIPRTRHGIIELLMINLEQQPDHASHWISSAIAGHQRSYLQLLADHMTHAGKSNTTQAAGLSVIGDCTNRLRKNVGLHGSPKPQHILNELADHHVLRRRSSKPPSFAFSHQQIQEWFASHALHDDLVSIAASNEPNDFARFKSDVINRPNMEQSILFLVDRLNDDIGAGNQIATALNEARCLLAMAIEVDPLFAAKLVGYFESSVWSNVKGIFAKKLRAWHNSESEVQRKLATTAMLLTRSGDFSDIVVPLVEGENQAVRLDTYRLVEPFPLTTLGSDWQRRIDNWPEDRRGELIRELTSNDVGLEGIDLALKWIKTDTSPKIAAQGLELLVWIQAGPALVEALSNASYEILIEAAEQAVFDFLELDDLHRVRARLHELLNLKSGLVPDTVVWRTVHALVRLDDPLVKDKAVKLLRNDGAYALQADVVAYLKKHSPKALTCWLLDQMSNQQIYETEWDGMLRDLPVTEQKKLAKCLLVRAQANHPSTNLTGFAKISHYCKSQPLVAQFLAAQNEDDAKSALRGILLAFSTNNLLPALMPSLSETGDPQAALTAMELITSLLLEGSMFENVELRKELLICVRRFATRASETEDDIGKIGAVTAHLLSIIAEPEDLAHVVALVKAEGARIRRGRLAHDAWAVNRVGPQPHRISGYSECASALEPFKSFEAVEALLALTKIPEVEDICAKAIADIVSPPPKELTWRHSSSLFAKLAEWRSARMANAESPVNTNAIDLRAKDYAIARLNRSISTGNSHYANMQPGAMVSLARIAGITGLDAVLAHAPNFFAKWDTVAALEQIVLQSEILSGAQIAIAFEPMVAAFDAPVGVRYGPEVSHMLRLTGILLASDAPESGIALIERVRLPVRDVIELLAASRCDAAIDYLLRMDVPEHAMDTYVRVLRDNPTDGIVDFFVDAMLTGAPAAKCFLQGNNHWDVVRMVATKAAVNPTLFEKLKLHAHVDAELIVARWLASVFAEIGTEEAVFAVLELIGEKHWPETRGSVTKAVFEACSTRRYLDGSGHSYAVKPVNSDEVRRVLLAIAANDALRKESALDLLASIASQRHAIGWANDETRHPGLGAVASFVDMALSA